MKQEATTPPPRIVVLGSLNMDLLLRVPHAPDAGETLMGRSLDRIPGGIQPRSDVRITAAMFRDAMCNRNRGLGPVARGAIGCGP